MAKSKQMQLRHRRDSYEHLVMSDDDVLSNFNKMGNPSNGPATKKWLYCILHIVA